MTQAGPAPENEPAPAAPPAPAGPAAPPPGWQQSLTSTTSVPGPAGLFYADVPNRIVAFVIDIIVLAIIGAIVSLVLGGLLGGVTSSPSLDSAGGELNPVPFLIVSVVQLGVSLLYFGYSWSVQRATPGMRLLGLQIGDEADGRSIDRRQALVRWLVLGIPSILATLASYVSTGVGLVLSLVGIVWLAALLWSIAQSPTKQGYHDRAARTIMVKSARRVG